jgi:hypothetical protein
MQATFYKGEDISFVVSSEADLSVYTTKVVKFFTPHSPVKTATVTEIDNNSFSVKLAAADTAGLTVGALNIVLEFTENDKMISKMINARVLDPYIDGGIREESSMDSEIVFLTEDIQVTVNFVNFTVLDEIIEEVEGYRDEAEAAKLAAIAAKDDAETAALASQLAQSLSEAARDAAQFAQAEAEDAQTNAVAAMGAAQTAQGLSEEARDASQLAQSLSEAAQSLAEAAQAAAEEALAELESEQVFYISDDDTSVVLGVGETVVISESTEGYDSVIFQLQTL